jgi:6-phosphogluconate dehydrogenase
VPTDLTDERCWETYLSAAEHEREEAAGDLIRQLFRHRYEALPDELRNVVWELYALSVIAAAQGFKLVADHTWRLIQVVLDGAEQR